MRLTETKGLVMATFALDEADRQELAEAPLEMIVERVKNELRANLGEKLVRDVLISYDRGENLIAAIRI